MDIVLALHQFPPFGGGGTEVLAGWIADTLRANGHGVRLVSAIPHGATTGAATLPPDDVVRFLPPRRSRGEGAARIRREYDDADAGDAFGAVLDERRPDVVHFLHLAGLTAGAVRATAARGIRAVFTATDFWFECPTVQLLLCDHSRCAGPGPGRLNCARHLMEIRHPALRALSAISSLDRPAAVALRVAARVPGLRRMTAPFDALAARSPVLGAALASVAAVVAPTAYMRERLARFGVPAERLHLVRFGVPRPNADCTAEVNHDAQRMRIAFVGTLAPHKGAHLLVDALAQLRDVSLQLDLHGDVTDAAYCRALQAAAGADARIRLRGRFASADIGRVLRNADVLVIPSLWDENTPLVLLQAIAHRCPVLVSDVPGLLEAMRLELDGWAFRRNDAGNLAGSLRRLAADPACLARVRSAPAAIRSIDDHVADLLTLYDAGGAAAAMRP
jgi:glycosyltransferase involved in cell wall biosynthesis